MRQNRSKDKSQSAEQDYSDVLELVEQLAEVLDRTDLTEIRIRDNELEVQVSRYRGSPNGYNLSPSLQSSAPGAAVETSPLRTETADVPDDTQGQATIITAPMPARFYRSPGPDEPPFVEVGDTVRRGEPVAVLEVMKTYNPVEAPFDCEIVEVLAEDGDAVEYSQPLFRVKQIF